jgi:hypothetical protein
LVRRTMQGGGSLSTGTLGGNSAYLAAGCHFRGSNVAGFPGENPTFAIKFEASGS